MMENNVASFPILDNRSNPIVVIRSFVTYMADETRKLDTFVLFIDEAMSIETIIFEKFNVKGITDVVRNKEKKIGIKKR